jgi:hypothetical protein
MLIRDSDLLLIFEELHRLRRECAILKEMLTEFKTQVSAAPLSADSKPDHSNHHDRSEQRMPNLRLVGKARSQKA